MLRCEGCGFRALGPFSRSDRIQHGLERLAAHGPQGWAPAVDLCETQDAFVFTVELPGLAREQVRIDVHDNKLTLQGRREARVSCESYLQVERGHGEFCRTFLLPHAVIRGWRDRRSRRWCADDHGKEKSDRRPAGRRIVRPSHVQERAR